jgi:hypothetical protein
MIPMMKLPVQTTLVCALALLLLACDSNPGPDALSSEPAKTAEPAAVDAAPLTANADKPLPGPGQYVVDLTGEGVAIRANQVDELELFKGVAEAAGFELFTENFDWKVVTVDIQADTLHAAVVELVKAYPYEIVYAPGEVNREEVLGEVVLGKPLITEAEGSKSEVADDKLAAHKAIENLTEYDQQYAYLKELDDPSPEIRAAAAKKIKPVGDAMNRLADMVVNDPSPEVRIATTWSLEVSDPPESEQALQARVKCLQDKDFNVVVECIQSLSFLGDETTVVYLQPMLTHQDEGVRTEAFEAIGSLQ